MGRLPARLLVFVWTTCNMISFLAPNLSPSATTVFFRLVILTEKISTPALKLQIGIPFCIRHNRMLLSRDPDATMSLSWETAQHQTCETYIKNIDKNIGTGNISVSNYYKSKTYVSLYSRET